jgi:hypothetical protein
MRGGARHETAVLRKDGQSRRWDGGAREESDCEARGATAVTVTATGGRRGRMGSTPTRVALFIGGHPIRPLRLLPPYDAHYNGYILTIL